MNRQAISAIKSLVLTLRRKLEEDVAILLRRHGQQDNSKRSLRSLLVQIGETGHADRRAK